jgi:hypothetical protein
MMTWDATPPVRIAVVWLAAAFLFSAAPALLASEHETGFAASAGTPSEYSQTGDQAYLIVPITLVASAKPKPVRETGTMTFTFQRTAGDWKISTLVWTTAHTF